MSSKIFGKDENITCILVPTENKNEEGAFFDAYIQLDSTYRYWYDAVFWANSEKKAKILVLCKEKHIRDSVRSLTDIPPGNLDIRKKQADKAGLVHFEVNTGGEFAMIYY